MIEVVAVGAFHQLVSWRNIQSTEIEKENVRLKYAEE